MAGQGCPNEGSDTRLLGQWGCRIQSALSFHSDIEPMGLLLCFPPFVALNLPLPRGRYLSIRAGFRYDRNWRGYIFPEAIVKVKSQPIYY